MPTYQFQEHTRNALAETAAFLNFVMKKSHFTAEFLKWQYLDNPEGTALAVCAMEQGKIAGHYSAQPITAGINGEIVQGLFILNAAVDPSFQGKGLLRGIADTLHEAARSQGFRFMIGVGNNNSTPIYTQRFGFRLLAPLDVKIGLGLPVSGNKVPYYYEKIWTEESLIWRLSNPCEKYKIQLKNNQKIIYKSNYPLLSSILGIFGTDSLQGLELSSVPGLRLYIGIDPAINWKQNKTYVNFPEFAKPSPLNLIFRELQTETIPVSSENILFRCIDFDAF